MQTNILSRSKTKPAPVDEPLVFLHTCIVGESENLKKKQKIKKLNNTNKNKFFILCQKTKTIKKEKSNVGGFPNF